jgi:hypothetical protein
LTIHLINYKAYRSTNLAHYSFWVGLDDKPEDPLHMHPTPSPDEIKRYIESHKSEIGTIQTLLQDDASPEEIRLAGKRIVLCAASMDEAVSRLYIEIGGRSRTETG